MGKLKQLQEKRADLMEKATAIHELAKKEDRSLTKDENKAWKSYLDEADELEISIKNEKRQEQVNKDLATRSFETTTKNSSSEKKELRKYSIGKFLRESSTNSLSGLELEMHQEAEREARALGLEITNNGIPSMILNLEKGEQRDHTVGTNTEGGHTVSTDLAGFIPALKNRLIVQQMGANFMTGLRGNLAIPRQTGFTSATWKAENGAADETNITFDQVVMTPKRLAAFSEVSKQLLAQSSLDVDAILQNDLVYAMSAALDLAAINGSGASNQPLGILNASGVGTVATGTNGSAPTWANIVGLESEIANSNADVDNMGYLINAKTRGKLKSTLKDSGSGMFLYGEGNEPLNGYRTGVTNQLASNGTKGSGTNLSNIIFGNFNDLMIGQWGGLDVTVDPYTKAKEGTVVITIDSFFDIALRHPESFAKMVGVITA